MKGINNRRSVTEVCYNRLFDMRPNNTAQRYDEGGVSGCDKGEMKGINNRRSVTEVCYNRLFDRRPNNTAQP